MSLTMVIAIVLAAVFIAFCALCIWALFSNQKETRDFSERISHLEEDLDVIRGMLDESMRRLHDIQKPAPVMHSAPVDRVEPERPKKAAKPISTEEPQAASNKDRQRPMKSEPQLELDEMNELDLDDIFAEISREGIEDSSSIATGNGGSKKSIDVDDLISDFEGFERRTLHGIKLDLAEQGVKSEGKQETVRGPQPEREKAPARQIKRKEPERSRRQHTGYDVGKSGKEYTPEELNMLIRD